MSLDSTTLTSTSATYVFSPSTPVIVIIATPKSFVLKISLSPSSSKYATSSLLDEYVSFTFSIPKSSELILVINSRSGENEYTYSFSN